MTVIPLCYQNRLSVTEYDHYLSRFLVTFHKPSDEPSEQDEGLLKSDIYLGDKGYFLQEALNDFEKCLRRQRKMAQTESLTALNKLRLKLYSAVIAFIRLSQKSSDETISAAALSLNSLLDQFKGIYSETNLSKSSVIKKFIAALRSETYLEAFGTLELEAKVNELEEVNEQYIQLYDERDKVEKTMPDSPSEVRQRCVKAYRDLVALINFALKKNKYYIYDEKAKELNALTASVQELIDLRRNGGKQTEEESVIENTDSTVTEE